MSLCESPSPPETRTNESLDSPYVMQYAGPMNKPARTRKNAVRFPTHAKDRWMPNDTTRPQTFADRRKVADKRACRGRIFAD